MSQLWHFSSIEETAVFDRREPCSPPLYLRLAGEGGGSEGVNRGRRMEQHCKYVLILCANMSYLQ